MRSHETWSHRVSWKFSSHKGHSQENLSLKKTHEMRLRPNSRKYRRSFEKRACPLSQVRGNVYISYQKNETLTHAIWDTGLYDFVFIPGHHPRFKTYTNPFPCHIQPICAICILRSAICILLKFLGNVVLESISVLFRRKISILHKSNFVES
jgi:hypothetical protein